MDRNSLVSVMWNKDKGVSKGTVRCGAFLGFGLKNEVGFEALHIYESIFNCFVMGQFVISHSN